MLLMGSSGWGKNQYDWRYINRNCSKWIAEKREGRRRKGEEREKIKENEITESLTHNFRSITCIGKWEK